MRVACKQLRGCAKRDKTGDAARILSVVFCAMQARDAFGADANGSDEPNISDALSHGDDGKSKLLHVLHLVLQVWYVIVHLIANCQRAVLPVKRPFATMLHNVACGVMLALYAIVSGSRRSWLLPAPSCSAHDVILLPPPRQCCQCTCNCVGCCG